jgi:hypothetical protein
MVTAIVMIKAETRRIPDLANQIAFRAYSKKDLEAGFELGLD